MSRTFSNFPFNTFDTPTKTEVEEARKNRKKRYKEGTVGGAIQDAYGDEIFGSFNNAVNQTVARLAGGPDMLSTPITPEFVPVGFNANLYSFNNNKNLTDIGQFQRRQYLDAAAPKLQKAIKKGDIFAYNAAINSLRRDISKTEGGPSLPKALPDRLELRRKAFRNAQRNAPVSSRVITMGFGTNPGGLV